MTRLPDELVEELLNDIEDAGEKHAQAKADRFDAEEQRRITKSELMAVAESIGKRSVAAKEQYAHSTETYKRAVKRAYDAILAEGQADYRMRLAEKRFEAWRTINANMRAARV